MPDLEEDLDHPDYEAFNTVVAAAACHDAIEHMSEGQGIPNDFVAIELFCGFGETDLREFMSVALKQGYEVNMWNLIAACTMLHTANTYRQVHATLVLLGAPWRSHETMKHHVRAFLIRAQTIYVDNEEKRFEHVIDSNGLMLFPLVTCIVDGVPVYCRACDSFYNGKKKRKYINFQCCCSVVGRPLVRCTGRPGRINDTKAFEQCPFKGPHYKLEQVQADGGYPACAHCVYPYYQERDETDGKKRSKADRKKEKKSFTPADRVRNDVYNKALRHSRTIVEIMFGMFQRHRFMSGSQYRVPTVCLLFNLMFEMEKIRYDRRPHEMHKTKAREHADPQKRKAAMGGVCDCGWAKVYSTSKLRKEYDARRDLIAGRCVKKGVPEQIRAWKGKPAAHAKRNAKPSKAQIKYAQLSLDGKLSEKQRVDLMKPEKEEQKKVDDASAEFQTQRVGIRYVKRSHKRERAPTNVSEAPTAVVVDDVSTDSSMMSDSDSESEDEEEDSESSSDSA